MENILSLPDLERLRAFVVFVESENIVKASEKLKVSQPHLSKALHGLEKELGVSLFEMRGRKKCLSPKGQAIYPEIKASLQKISFQLRDFAVENGARQDLRIGGRREILEDIFSRLHFEGNLNFLPMPNDEIAKNLKEHSIDLAVGYIELDSSELIRKKLFSDEPVICWNRQLKLTKSWERSSTAEVLNELSVYRNLDYGERSKSPGIFAHYQIDFKRLLRTTIPDWRRIVLAVESTPAWTIIPSRYLHQRNVNYVGFDQKIATPTQFFLYYQKAGMKYPWMQSAIREILSIFS